jgi:hypothetical protein
LEEGKAVLHFSPAAFQKRIIQQITTEDLLQYRTWRASKGAGAVIINMETGILRRIFKRAKRWHLMEDDIRPLREKPSRAVP